MKFWLGALTVLAALVALAVVLLDLPVAWRLDILFGAVGFGWLLLVLTLPWDLHFQAKNVLYEIDRSLARGLRPETNRGAVQRIARRTLGVAVGLHLLSALGVALAAWWSAWAAGGWIAGVYLASTVLRPLGAWYVHLRGELSRAMGEATHPRDDVIALRERVRALEGLPQELRSLREQHEAALLELREADRALDRKLDLVGRRFEESLEHLTDNRELLAGLRAFLRMIREPVGG